MRKFINIVLTLKIKFAKMDVAIINYRTEFNVVLRSKFFLIHLYTRI